MRPDANTVVVALIRLDEPPARVVLGDEEQAQAARFVFERDRARYIAAHTAMRVLLGRFLDSDPAALRFATAPRGKPRLADASADLRFNLSHSGDRALLAAVIGREVGVDIEQTRVNADMLGVAETVFSPAERARLREAPSDTRHEVFFRIWTRKESFIKAHGDGMHFPLTGFDVSSEPAGSQLLLACPAAPEEMPRWTMRALPCEPGYTAAITVEGDRFDVLSIPYSAARR